MDGIETLKEIKKSYPDLPVIIVSSSTYSSASITFECLQLGASDFITKPEGIGDRQEIYNYLRDSLIPKLKIFSRQKIKYTRTEPFTPSSFPKKSISLENIDLVCIGISTGGTTALSEVIPYLPENFPVPIVIILHIPPVFSKSFAERLDKISKLKVVEIESGMKLEAGMVYLAPGDFHVTINCKNLSPVLELNSGEKVNFCRPSIDVFFSSAALACKNKILGIIMTGMGTDGLNGSRLIKENGGIIVAQDEESSTVWGMPGAVVKAGLSDYILSLGEISIAISKIADKSK